MIPCGVQGEDGGDFMKLSSRWKKWKLIIILIVIIVDLTVILTDEKGQIVFPRREDFKSNELLVLVMVN